MTNEKLNKIEGMIKEFVKLRKYDIAELLIIQYNSYDYEGYYYIEYNTPIRNMSYGELVTVGELVYYDEETNNRYYI